MQRGGVKFPGVLTFAMLFTGAALAETSIPLQIKTIDAPILQKMDVAGAPDGKILTLPAAFKAALGNYENIEIAYLRSRNTDLLPWRATAALLPRVNGGGAISYPKEEIAFDTIPVIADPSKTANITVRQPLFDGQVFPAIKGALDKKQGAREDRRFQVREALFQVAQAFFDLLKEEQLQQVADEALRLTTEQQRIVKARYDGGEVPKTDLLRAEVEASRASRKLADAIDRKNLALSTLASFVGIPVAQLVDYKVEAPKESLPLYLDTEEDLQKYVQEAYRKRNDLEGASRNLDAARWALKQAWMGFLPRAEFEVQQAWIDPETFSQKNNFWTAYFKFNVPLFAGGERIIEIKENKNRLKEAQLRYQRLKKDIAIQVQQAWLDCRSARTNLEGITKELELSEENYKVIRTRYEAGQATSLDSIDAYTQLVSSKINVVNETFNYQLAALNLTKQIGIFGEDYVDAQPY